MQYTELETYSPDDPVIRNINNFIQVESSDAFFGTQMMVAEWREVPLSNQNYVSGYVYIYVSVVHEIFKSKNLYYMMFI